MVLLLICVSEAEHCALWFNSEAVGNAVVVLAVSIRLELLCYCDRLKAD